MLKELENRNNYKSDISGIQYIAFDILVKFDEICRKHKIDYWLDSGTLLGAMRHKGFIPWDDDIDVCIMKEDEKKLIDILKKELPYYLYVTNAPLKRNQEALKFYKIRDRYSMSLEDFQEERHAGIWIDIFIMNEIKNDFVINSVIKRCPTENINISDNLIKKIMRNLYYKFILIFFKVKTKSELKEKYYKKLTNLKKRDYVIYTEGEMCWHTYNKKWIFPLKEIQFEGKFFKCPNNVDKYLKSYYGNYMKLPPENKRKPHWKYVNIFKTNLYNEGLEWEKRKEHYKNYEIGKKNENR